MEGDSINYVVVIIGAGPGGVVLARELAKNGIKVTIYERGGYDQLGHNWSDAVELVALEAAGLDMPKLSGSEWKGNQVKNKSGNEGIFENHAVSRLKVNSPGLKSCKEIDFRMITTDRNRLGKYLVDEAKAAGAEVHYNHEGLELLYREKGRKAPDGVDVYGVAVKNLDTGEILEVRADLVVESSGFNSVLRKSLPTYTGLAESFKEGDFALVHREVRIYEPEVNTVGSVPDQYRYGFHTGYQWSHIHNEVSIDVGAGVKNDPANPDPKDIIDEFINRHPAIKSKKIRGGRSLCIVGSPLTNFVTTGFFVIGDAASTSVPTTGCGVGSAVLSALWAAEVIVSAAEAGRNDIDKLWAINTKFFRDTERGAYFAALSSLRMVLQTFSHEELDFIFVKDLLDAATLQDAINGVYNPPGIAKTIKALKGLGNLPLLLRLNRAVSFSNKIYKHYKKYPDHWDEQLYLKWKARANELHSLIQD